MATTLELMDELGEIIRIRDQAFDAFDTAPTPEDEAEHFRVYEAAEKRLQDWMDRDVPDKCAALLAFSNRCNATHKWRLDEAKRWKESAASVKRKSEWLEGLAKQLLLKRASVTGEAVIVMPGHRIAKVRTVTTERVQVDDLDALPPACVRVKREPDKVKIKAAIRQGLEIRGATLTKTTTEKVSVVEGVGTTAK